MIEHAYKYTSSSSSMPIDYGMVGITINLLIIYKTELVLKSTDVWPCRERFFEWRTTDMRHDR